MNPCRCGNTGTPQPCECPPNGPERYVGRISGPLRDRIDLWVGMPRLPAAALITDTEPEPSATVAARIAVAREVQLARPPHALNGRVAGRALRAACRMSPEARRRAIALADMERLSGHTAPPSGQGEWKAAPDRRGRPPPDPGWRIATPWP